MKRLTTYSLLGAGLIALAGITGVAVAQSGPLATAITQGTVGEQADGYLGIAKPVAGDIKAQVEALNIKRRAAYTDQAVKHGVSLSDWAATIGCQTLRRVAPGEAYRLGDGAWRVRGAGPITLPAVCG